MLLVPAIFVFNKLTILQGNDAEEISGRPDVTFSCKQNRTSNRYLFTILLILIWELKKRSQQNKGTLILGVEAPAAHQHSGFREISSKASFFVDKKEQFLDALLCLDYWILQICLVEETLCVLIYGETVYIFSYTHVIHENNFHLS